MSPAKRFVYILNSESEPNRHYTGLTSDLQRRIVDHNRGACSHTVNGRPWRLVVAIEFAREDRAAAFEQYLKSGSGCAFAIRHFR